MHVRVRVPPPRRGALARKGELEGGGGGGSEKSVVPFLADCFCPLHAPGAVLKLLFPSRRCSLLEWLLLQVLDRARNTPNFLNSCKDALATYLDQVCLSICLSVCQSARLSVYLSFCPECFWAGEVLGCVSMFFCLCVFVCLSTSLYICVFLSGCRSVCQSACLAVRLHAPSDKI